SPIPTATRSRCCNATGAIADSPRAGSGELARDAHREPRKQDSEREETMRQLDKRSRLTRRRFLQTTSVTAVGVGALATGTVLIDPRGAWAMTLTTLSPETAKTL